MDIDRRNRVELKSYFVKNSIPTEKNFADLIEGMLNQKEDGIVKLPGEPLSLQAAGDQTSLKKLINFYDDFSAAKPAWILSLSPRIDNDKPATAKPGWNLSDGESKSRLFIDRKTGYVGVGTVEPKALLDVGGLVRISEDKEGSRNISFLRDASDHKDAGMIVYKATTWGTDALSIVGAGKHPNRKLLLYDDITISGGLTVSGGLTISGGLTVAKDTQISGSLRVDENPLWFKKGSDKQHGLGWYNQYAGKAVDGPVLFGNLGGALATTQTKEKMALRWDQTGVEIKGRLEILTDSNPVRFSSKWSGFTDEKATGDPKYKKNQAEISNDTDGYKALMIVGNRSAELLDEARRVQVWDRLEVCGDLLFKRALIACSGGDKWKDNKSHPVRNYFRDKLKELAAGTFVLAMTDKWDDALFFGWVNKDKKAKLGYIKINEPIDVGVL